MTVFWAIFDPLPPYDVFWRFLSTSSPIWLFWPFNQPPTFQQTPQSNRNCELSFFSHYKSYGNLAKSPLSHMMVLLTVLATPSPPPKKASYDIWRFPNDLNSGISEQEISVPLSHFKIFSFKNLCKARRIISCSQDIIFQQLSEVSIQALFGWQPLRQLAIFDFYPESVQVRIWEFLWMTQRNQQNMSTSTGAMFAVWKVFGNG